MTMDVHRRPLETSPRYLSPGAAASEASSEGSPSPPAPAAAAKPPTKRSFDVAFLMAPDDSARKRQEEVKRQLRLVTTASLMPGYSPPPPLLPPPPKSAFTKVGHPPPPTAPPAPVPGLEPQYFPQSKGYCYPPSGGGAIQIQEEAFARSPYKEEKVSVSGSGSKGSKVYAGAELGYAGLAVPYGFPAGLAAPPLLTAANVTAALLPPSLAALALPAQNVCAKCNVSFRMTSDLVYHMRSQHKNDALATDSARRRREQDKLRCPVCDESFRERHHLTRHMTAHQDKEGDDEEDEPRRSD